MDTQQEQKITEFNKSRNKSIKFKGKNIKVIIIGDAKKEFENINKKSKEEILKGITKSQTQTLLSSLKQKIELLKKDPEYGTHISKNKIPKKYLKLEINNLWKINLTGAWRMLYSIKSNKIEIVSLILEIIDHKKYEKILNYKKS